MMQFDPRCNVHLSSDGGGEHVDPRQDDVLATTDAQPKGFYVCTVTITTSNLDDSKALFEVQRRDSDDDDDPVEYAIVAVPVDDSKQFDFAFSLELNERITVVPYTDLIGTVMVAINWQRLR